MEGINDIPTTTPWMIPYFQGGYEEAKKYTSNSHQKIRPICPDCGRVKDKEMTLNTIYRNESIGCICSDNISYCEKFIFNVLSQLNLDFKTQLTKTTFKWIGHKRYDFYFKVDNEEIIIETHGKQH